MVKEDCRKRFGEQLRKERKAAKKTQQWLAEKVGVDHSQISWWESGKRPPPDNKMIYKLAEALGCNAATLCIAAGRLPL